jgi:hypothetical protein
MPRTKKVEDTGDVITVPVTEEKETFQKKSLSYTQAKKLVKKEMTPKQQEHIEKLKAMNKERWNTSAKKKEEELKEKIRKELEEEMKGKQQVIVEPKKVYKPRVKKPEPEEEEEEEEEEEPTPMPVKAKVKHQVEPEQIKQTLNKVEQILNKQNRYSSMLHW